jgi:type IV pilus assembly protein PilB
LGKAALNRKYEEVLRRRKLLTEEQIGRAVAEASRRGECLHQVVVDMHLLDATTALQAAAEEWGIGYVELMDEELDPDVVKIFPEAMAKRLMSIPIGRSEDALSVAMADPFDLFALREIEIRIHSKLKIQPYLALPSEIKRKLEEIYGRESEEVIYDFLMQDGMDEISEIEEYFEGEDQGPEIDLIGSAIQEAQQSYIIRLVWKIILQAIKEGASDIHIEPFQRESAVRFRIDGDLQYKQPIPRPLHSAVVSRIKILSKMNIAEKRVPQDGRIGLKVGSRKVELRVSVIPTVFGESVVMRILDKSQAIMPLSDLGFRDENLRIFEEMIRKPYGMILVSGPTGSGKSTTLFSALNTIKRPELKILTAEDPVEYNIEGIVQVQVKEEIGLTFARVLRSFLRQDPDIIMIGEMRDQETASIAVRAALTGHLVFSTVHTNDAASSVTRLVDFGIDPFLVADSVLLIIAQRLVHKICESCKEEIEPTEEMLKILQDHRVSLEELHISRGKGCKACNFTGLKGRTAIHELLVVDEDIKELIAKGATAMEIKEFAREDKNMRTLREDGLEKVAKGITTFEEVISRTLE